jgi:ABC-type transporter Mla subunit MlaD
MWILELFVWLLILFAVSGGILFARYNHRKNFDTYQIFLPDVDGLIKGSPVKILGIQVGYVNQLEIVGEDVYVKFIVTEKNVRVPAETIATVEFSGLGGSKSLELYPPNAKSIPTDKFIVPQAPKRIHDSLGVLNDMFNQVIDITYTVSHFMNKVGIIKDETAGDIKPQSADGMLNNSNNWLDNAQKQCDKLKDGLNNKKDGKNGKVVKAGNGKNE